MFKPRALTLVLTSAAALASMHFLSATIIQPAISISNVSWNASATTVQVSWQTSVASDSVLRCGTASGSYTFNAVDNGTQSSVTSHSGIVAGLQARTSYVCQAQSRTASGPLGSAIVNVTTAAEPNSTPITGLAIGGFTPYNANGQQMDGDTFYNCISNDSTTYVTLDDSNGFGLGMPGGSNQMLGKLISESPALGADVNFLPSYGTAGGHAGSDNLGAKASGLYCHGGNIYMITERVGSYAGNGAVQHLGAQIIKSPDHGQSWSNFQYPSTYNVSGSMTYPADATMFGSHTLFGASAFIIYGADDGSSGYRVDNADAYTYIMGNDGYWNNGNALYLARIPKAKLPNLNPSDITYYVGGDGNSDAAWASSIARIQPILSADGHLSEPAIQYVPALNRYLLFEWYYPNNIQCSPANSANSQWITYEAPHPWGPWNLIDTRNWPTQGYYNPVPLQRSALSGTTMTLMSTGNFNADWSAYPNLSTAFTYQMYASPVEILTAASPDPSSVSGTPFSGVLDATGVPRPAAAYSLRRLTGSYRGSPVRVVRWTDGSSADISFTSAGNLDVAALMSFCAGTTCTASKWYDQSGNRSDATQAVLSKQPIVVDSGQLIKGGPRGIPALEWKPGTVGFVAPTSITGPKLEAVMLAALNPKSPSWAVMLEAWDGSANSGTASLNNADVLLRTADSNGVSNIRYGAENDSVSIPMDALTWMDSQFTGTAMNLYVGTGSVISSPSSGNFTANALIIGSADDSSTTWAMQGTMSELIVFTTNLSGDTGGALYTNQQTYYSW
jgi:Alpha-L-arabinofuranosidase B, catalytic/Domain of unknown function (DUF4185)